MAMIGRLKVVSGGQTGVDRAALDAARRLRLPFGGWCPQGRRTENGPLPRRYRLKETPSRNYEKRTRWNVRDSDGTLIVNRGPLDGGTFLTVRLARESYSKPLFIQPLDRRLDIGRFHHWLACNRIRTLNVAGPRESKRPGVQAEATKALLRMLSLATLKRGGSV